jgi:hypothetical protein
MKGMQPDLLAYNAAFSACGKVGQWQQAQKLFGDGKQSGDVTTDTWTLNACSCGDRWRWEARAACRTK